MDNELTLKYRKMFDSLKELNDDNIETWSARNIMSTLGYERWENFYSTIDKAITASRNSGIDPIGQFRETTKVKIGGNGSKYLVKDYSLTRYACYLIAQNGDSSKPQIAAAQTYFAIQTFRQEQMEGMSEDQKRLYIKSQVTAENSKLFATAKESGVFRFGTFYDQGYIGLYGLNSKQIKDKKGLGKDNILDRAGSTELAANLFRITQTQEKLQSQLVYGNKLGDSMSARYHNMVGGKVRQAIKDIGGTLPEDLAPEENIKFLEKRIKLGISSTDQNKISLNTTQKAHESKIIIVPRGTTKSTLLELNRVLQNNRGTDQVTLIFQNTHDSRELKLPFGINYSASLKQEIAGLLQIDQIVA